MSEGTDLLDHAEYELLTLFGRVRLEEAQVSRAVEILESGTVNWEYLVAISAYHGVQPLLYRHLREVRGDSPDALIAQLRGVVGARSAYSLLLVQELGRLAALFRREDLALLAVKGPVLAQSIYGGVAFRPFSDLDLIIQRGSFDRVEALLRGEGYDSVSLTPFQKASYLFIHGQYTFWRRIEGMGSATSVLDVHTAVMPPGYSYTEDFDALFDRSITIPMGGVDTNALSREDLLHVLCYHGLKNRWDRLKYFCDVAELLRAYPDLDWDVIYSRACAMRSRRVLRLGLSLAHRLLDAPLPKGVWEDVERDRNVEALTEAILERLPRQAHMRVEPYWDRVRLNLLSQDSMLGGLRYGAYAAARRVSELYLPEPT